MVARLDEVLDESPRTPLVFATAASDEVRLELLKTRCPVIDFFGLHMERVESILEAHGVHKAARLHGVGDIKRYNSRMQAVEYTIEHDDGQSVRGLEKADVILVAPSRCGKTPTAMYLALQHGLFVANYPIVDEDLETNELPRPVRDLRDKCFGLITTPQRLSAVRQERRPNSRYASIDQCTFELRRTEAIFKLYSLPVVDTSTKSVEEISTIVLQSLKTRKRRPTRRPPIEEHTMNDTPRHVATSGPSPSWDSTTSSRSAARTPRSARWSATSPSSACNVPDGFATTADAYRRFIGDTGLAEEISGKLQGPRHRRHPRAGARWARRSARRWRRATSPRTSSRHPGGVRRARGRARRRVLRRTVQRDRRGPARRVVRRPAGDLPEHQGHRRRAAGDPRGVRLALQRPGDRLPRAPRLRPRRRRALGRGAADGALRHRRLGRDVHDGHRVRVRRRGVHHLGLRARRGRRAGRGEPRRVLRLQAGAA